VVQRFIAKIFGMNTWELEARILKNTTDDETPPPGEPIGEPTLNAEQPAPGFVSQAESDTPVAH
jgi:hypothetical protein